MAYLKNGVPGDRLSFASPNVHHCSQWQVETNGNRQRKRIIFRFGYDCCI